MSKRAPRLTKRERSRKLRNERACRSPQGERVYDANQVRVFLGGVELTEVESITLIERR